METRRGDGMFGFHPYFDIRHNLDGKVVSCTRRPHVTLKEISWCLFLLEAEWTLGLLDTDRRLKISKEPIGSRTSTNCGITGPFYS
jgi:hypothetical protein